ncbi:MAG: FHA domain-containing protein [Kiritimatiellae bacterium]|nr:FHA domain-containing protein [Kiritimatiellia bacterium]
MLLRYVDDNGKTVEYKLGKDPITIGRAAEADIVITDEKASRLHCGIRVWDEDYFIRDLKSRNGTQVNGKSIEIAQLHAGDKIQIGSTVFAFTSQKVPGTNTALREVEKEMEKGKGYETILRELVDTSDS